MSYQDTSDQDMSSFRESIIKNMGLPESYLTGKYPEIIKFAVMIELNGERTLLGICNDLDNNLKTVSIKCRKGKRMREVFYISSNTTLIKPTAEDLLELDGVDTCFYDGDGGNVVFSPYVDITLGEI